MTVQGKKREEDNERVRESAGKEEWVGGVGWGWGGGGFGGEGGGVVRGKWRGWLAIFSFENSDQWTDSVSPLILEKAVRRISPPKCGGPRHGLIEKTESIEKRVHKNTNIPLPLYKTK